MKATAPLKRGLERLLKPIGKRFSFRFYFLNFIHYYWAIPERSELPGRIWEKVSEMPGVQMREGEQLRLVEELAERFGGEFEGLSGGQFGDVDAEMLYGLVRKFKPRRVIEIGSGQSTRITARALVKNQEETGIEADFTAIEPYPDEELARGVKGVSRLMRKKVQDVPVEEFEKLGEGDVLFIDSSHVLAIGSDVQYEFLEILPRVKKGVLVHVHDIFLPAEYHRHWVMEGRFWAEQYILQAFLAFNESFEVLLGGQFLHLKHPGALEKAVKGYARERSSPSSFWIRRVK